MPCGTRANVGVIKSKGRFTAKGRRMAKHLKGKVKEPYAVVQAKDHKKGLVKK
jgi:hypothetical protein